MFTLKLLIGLHRFRRELYRARMKRVARVAFRLESQKDFLDVRVVCRRGKQVVYLDPILLDQQEACFSSRLRPVLATFSRIKECDYDVIVSLHDGITSSVATTDSLFFSDHREGRPILVDPYFYANRGYRAYSKLELIPWEQRETKIVWRGSTTRGVGAITSETMCADDLQLCQRSRLVLLAKKWPQCDLKFTQLVQSQDEALDESRLSANEMMGEWVNDVEWRQYQFAMDVDGNLNSWSQFLKMAKLGCCIFKVSSPGGFKQWFSDEFIPMQHFIPIKADLSDFDAQVEWALANPGACQEIALAAYEVASAMTEESELDKTVAAVRAAIG